MVTVNRKSAAPKLIERKSNSLKYSIRKKVKEGKLKKRSAQCNTDENLSRLSYFKTILLSNSPPEESLVEAIRGLRILSSAKQHKYVPKIVKEKMIPLLVKALHYDLGSASIVVLESTKALSNIASTDYAAVVADAGAIPKLVHLMDHKDPNIREWSTLCVGNIAGEGSFFRDKVLRESSPINPLLKDLNKDNTLEHICGVLFTISTLCKGDPAGLGSESIKVLRALIFVLDIPIKKETKEIMKYTIESLSSLVTADAKGIDEEMNSDIFEKLIDLLRLGSEFQTPIVRIILHFLSGTDHRKNLVLESNIYRELPDILRCSKRGIRKCSAIIVSRIACENVKYVSRLATKKIVLRLIDIASVDHWTAREEGIMALANMFMNGTKANVYSLISVDGLLPLISVLKIKTVNVGLLLNVLDAIKRIFEVDENHIYLFQENQGIDYLEELQEHESDDVYDKAIFIIHCFFGVEGEDNENMAPAVDKSGQFSFGSTPFSNRKNIQCNDVASPPVFGRISTNSKL